MSVPDRKPQRRLGKAMRALRERAGISTQDVAERMGKKRSAAVQIGRWERGETNPASAALWSYLSAVEATFADLHRELDPSPPASERLGEIARELEHMAETARRRVSRK